jgi:hypothetical protein
MFSALFSFLGGSVFRMIWGEVSAAWTKHQDHKHELEALKLQADLEKAKHDQEMERLKVSSELHIKEVEVIADAEVEKLDAEAFIVAQKTLNQPTGNKIIDAWNGAIRPAAASTALLIWWFCLYTQGFVLTEWDKELVGVILGFYFAHRVFTSRGK